MKSRRAQRVYSPKTSSGFSKFFGSLLTQGDMSRLGRDYLKVGQVMEVLRQRGVRLIAINDGVDSLKGDDDFTPFRNIMNEFYARDTSRKISKEVS